MEKSIWDANTDLSECQLYYAPRSEAYFPQVQGLVDDVPTMFVGDAAGGTDYRLGLSGSRGLMAGTFIAESLLSLVQSGASWEESLWGAMSSYQTWWNKLVEVEFSQDDSKLTWRPDMYQKYLFEGRSYLEDATQLEV